MTDIIIEILRAIMVGGIIISFLKAQHAKELSKISGWWAIISGFVLIFFGTLIDITDNFEELNQFLIIGDTPVQAFLEKVVGYLMGFLMLAVGIKQWLPKVIEQGEMARNKHKLEVQEERVKVLRATMRTVHDIVNNFLNNLQLFQMEAREKNALSPESFVLMESIIEDTSIKLKKLGDLNSTPEIQMASGTGIDYEKASTQDSDLINDMVKANQQQLG
ncbi:hypothetical protein CAG64_05065 [Vibrio sp. V38_P2S17PM301]|uniref:hypothetical protein n=1 Tax=Vibrio sp. V38_P2S17PM301 TaxID=1938689 RepID=UPI001360D52E|nr:hypothetical protein [Vibrio sp. V38_P2S17PM301]NAX24854.1 hypothetical protein [Vibrio sp. V38_P2S17PM301]